MKTIDLVIAGAAKAGGNKLGANAHCIRGQKDWEKEMYFWR